MLLSENLFGAFGLVRLSANNMISPLLLVCLVLLTWVVAMRQTENGVWSIFVGAGIGSRIARAFAPVLLVIPFLIEVARTRILLRDLVPEQYGAAILTSLAAGLSMVLLLVLVWRINSMEKEIHDLTLRDELTGLYNMRGFYLLGEQTLRLAQRAELPFSVLFIDLDGLKKINDDQGHNTGSAYLADTGELVMNCFRETDVKGRFGGDEFVVAGQFSMVGIELAAQRLKSMAAAHNEKNPQEISAQPERGFVTLDHPSNESLKELVRRADEMMYREKRAKRWLAREQPRDSSEERVPETLTVLPDPKLFRLARWMQVASLFMAAIAVVFNLVPMLASASRCGRCAGEPAAYADRAGMRDQSGAVRTGKCWKRRCTMQSAQQGLGAFGGAVIIFWIRPWPVLAIPCIRARLRPESLSGSFFSPSPFCWWTTRTG